jgi:hypothetical protein
MLVSYVYLRVHDRVCTVSTTLFSPILQCGVCFNWSKLTSSLITSLLMYTMCSYLN